MASSIGWEEWTWELRREKGVLGKEEKEGYTIKGGTYWFDGVSAQGADLEEEHGMECFRTSGTEEQLCSP